MSREETSLVDLTDMDRATIIAALDVFADKMRNHDYGPGVPHNQAYTRRQERLDSIAAARAAITLSARHDSSAIGDQAGWPVARTASVARAETAAGGRESDYGSEG